MINRLYYITAYGLPVRYRVGYLDKACVALIVDNRIQTIFIYMYVIYE